MVTGGRSSQRLAVLYDADNVEIRGDGKPRRRVDYRRLLDRMNGRELGRAICFRPERNFPKWVQNDLVAAGFEVKTTAKNADAWIAAEAFALANKYDVIAFVGGDRDLEPVIHLLKAQGVRVEVWSWPAITSDEIKKIPDAFVALTNDLVVE